MSLFSTYKSKDQLTPEVISELAAQYNDAVSLSELTELRGFVINNLPRTANVLASVIPGKKVSVILNSLINELPNLTNPGSVFLGKYLVDNKNPTVSGSINFKPNVVLSRRMEMLQLLRRVGAYDTALFYLLVIYHME